MRLEQLQYLVAIAQNHSFTLTAERYFITQQAISKSLKQLEVEIGAVLLERHSSGVTLTKQGQIALEFAQKVLNDFNQLLIDVSSINSPEKSLPVKRCIRIGSASALNIIIMPKILNISKRNEKHFTINITETSPTDICENLVERKFDFGILCINSEDLSGKLHPYINDELQYKLLAKDHLVACVSENSYYATQEIITSEQTLTSNRTLYGINPIDKRRKKSIGGSITCSNDMMFHKKLLLQDDIITIMPQLIYRHLFKSKKFVSKPLQFEEPVELVHCLIYCKDVNEDLQDFIFLVEECMQKL